MLCSDEACVIINTLVSVLATAANVRAATPGTPSIPRPSTVTMLRSQITVSALICPGTASRSRRISVPGLSG